MQTLRNTCLLAAVMAVGFAGCGSSTKSANVPVHTTTVVKVTQPPGGPGTYTYTDPSGAVFTVMIPADPRDPLAKLLSTDRQKLGVTAPIGYASVNVDNSRGSQNVALDATSPVLEVVSSSGQTIDFQTADRQTACVAEQNAAPCSASGSTVLYNYDIGVYNKLLDTNKALPGATTRSLWVTTTRQFTISRVFLLQAPPTHSRSR